MLNCSEVTHIASDYLDKNMNWKDSCSMKMHITMCKHCRHFLRHLRLTIDCVHDMENNLTSTEEILHITDNISDRNQT